MCQQCQEREAKDRAMWEAIRIGFIGMQRGLGAIVKAIEKRYEIKREDNRRAA